ncbi:non-specific serine/threonine protein kinase [Anaeramoeba ignava]|uniref:Non-specific serine/threonine protein kinase n=1 Tax=Anaeramoeba ignava TaxID=1746090 RepID=A0A9Q0LXY6_ANAIG|nr:non-specific serine/threonine protein kinase [Anaeramoeba ignava]
MGQTSSKNKKLKIKQFELLQTLGKGGFGKVMLARSIKTKQFYAIKSLRKSSLIKTKTSNRAFSEKNSMKTISSPFVVSFFASFQSEEKLYFVLEYISGGSLAFHLRFTQFSDSQIQFFASELILALRDIHQKNYIYRDLKPDNILFDSEGHLKIIDLGLAKKIEPEDTNRHYTRCGTIHYSAPEVLLGKQYGKEVDWWSLGILLFELFHGYPPFRSQNQIILASQILIENPDISDSCSKDLKDLIKKLLEKNPLKRIGTGETGILEIQKHPFFADVNWEEIENKTAKPNFEPFGNFDQIVEMFNKQKKKDSVFDSFDPYAYTAENTPKIFEGFDWICEEKKI